MDLPKYALGSAATALSLTLPIQLLLGYVLAPSRPAIFCLHLAVAWAQVCRQGPLWGAIFVAVREEVRGRVT